jgi:hypothetical protein
VITFETNSGNSNVVHISNEKHFYYHPNTQKHFVYIILSKLERSAKNAFSARQNAIFALHQKIIETNKRLTSNGHLVTFLEKKTRGMF